MKIKGKLPHNHRELGGGAAVDGAVDCRRPPTPVSKSVGVNNKMQFLGQRNTVIMIHNRCKTLNFPFMRNLGFGGPSDAGGNYCSSSKSKCPTVLQVELLFTRFFFHGLVLIVYDIVGYNYFFFLVEKGWDDVEFIWSPVDFTWNISKCLSFTYFFPNQPCSFFLSYIRKIAHWVCLDTYKSKVME